MRGLRDRIAIVAGAAPGNIGGATAFRLAQEGMKVTAADLNEAAARAVVDQIKSAGGHAMARVFDITDDDRIGIAYMYVGAWVKAASADHEFHVGPHLMVVSPNPDEFQGFNRDATNGMSYVTHLPNRTELFLVMPIRQWDER
jgi:hypothetical protein